MRAWSFGSLLVLVVVVSVNLVETARRVPPPSRSFAIPADPVMQQEQRFGALLAALKAHGAASPIGYRTDLSPDALAADSTAMREYLTSQFVLAPWILDARNQNCEWMIGNHRANATPAVPDGFRVVEDFGRGVLLLRKVAR